MIEIAIVLAALGTSGTNLRRMMEFAVKVISAIRKVPAYLLLIILVVVILKQLLYSFL